MKRVFILIAVFATAFAAVFADGGAMLFRKDAGPFVITAFVDHVPVRVGSADLSALVQSASGGSTVLDATVMIRLRQSGGEKITEIVAPATHARATNKLLYAAHVTLPAPGPWMFTIDVTRKDASGSASGELDVLPKEAPAENYWPYFAMVPLLVLAFAFNRWLRRKWNIRNPRARP